MAHIDEEQRRGLAEQLRLREQLRTERGQRIKYQAAVYAACRLVNVAEGRNFRTGQGTVANGLISGLNRVMGRVANLHGQLEKAEAKAEFEGKSAQAWCEMCHETQKRVEAESQQNWMLQQQLNNERRLCWEAERELKKAKAHLELVEAQAALPERLRERWLVQSRKDAVEAAASVVDRWAKSYPTSVFPAPPPGQHAETVDGCSAAALRSVLPKLAAAIRALAGGPHPERERTTVGVWSIDRMDDGRVRLVLPDGAVAFYMDADVAEMLGRMLLDAAEGEGG